MYVWNASSYKEIASAPSEMLPQHGPYSEPTVLLVGREDGDHLLYPWDVDSQVLPPPSDADRTFIRRMEEAEHEEVAEKREDIAADHYCEAIGFAVTDAQRAAADSDDWSNLTRLRSGDRVHVVQKNMSSVDAEFVRFSKAELVLRVARSEMLLVKDTVVRVSTKTPGGRVRHAKVGALVGAALGGLMAIPAYKAAGSGAAVFGFVFFTTASAGIGVLLPTGSTEVYRVKSIH